MTELDELLNLSLPTEKNLDRGFLESLGLSHYENLNSKIYSYFLTSEYSGVRSLFLDTLMHFVKERSTKRLILRDFEVVNEEHTGNGRIDMLIRDLENETAVIIENKIYHILNNNLADYWRHVKLPEQNKVGVVLSLKHEQIDESDNGNYFTLTHKEWSDQVLSTIDQYDIPNNLKVYIVDFCNSMNNLTESQDMNEKAEFFFNHPVQVLRAAETQQEAYKFVTGQIDQAAQMLGLQSSGQNSSYRYLWKEGEMEHTFYTIVFDGLLNGTNKLGVFIEMDAHDYPKLSLLDQELKDSPLLTGMKLNGTRTEQYSHFVYKEYALDLIQIKDLGSSLARFINQDFKPLMDEVHKIYSNSKDV